MSSVLIIFMRILLTADWHINDYKNFNPHVGFRLQQFIKLAHDTVEIGKKNNCPILVIAGDLIDVAVLKPSIQHVLKRVIDILKSGFDKVYYILGQHDLDTKGSITVEDTLLSLYDDDKFIYANHTILEYDNVKIGFQNWSTSQDTSWIEDKLDVLIGHYTKSNLFGQEIDDSKFDLMIHGDIHNSQVIGKFVSICNPIQKDMSSEASGSMIIYDTKQKDWERIKVDEPHQKYLRIEYTRNPEEEGFASPILYKIFKPVDVNASGEAFEVPIPEWSEINELIDGCVNRLNLKDIHEEILAKCNSYQEIDFNFQLKYIDIQNYRSVDHLRLDFEGNDIILLLGENGAGKSTILTALAELFRYDTHLNDNRSDFAQDDEQLQLEFGLFYQNKMFVIKKGAKWGLEIDGVEQGFPSKPQFENKLPEYLPFLNYSDVFFISSSVSNLSGRYTPERRSELLSKFFKFDKVLAYSQTAIDLRNATSIEFGNLEKAKASLENVMSFLKEKLDKCEQFTEQDSINCTEEISCLRLKKEKYEKYSSWSKSDTELKIKIETFKSQLSKLIPDPLTEVSNPDSVISQLEEWITTKTEALEKLKEEYKTLMNLRKEFEGVISERNQLEQQRVKLEQNVCPTCGEPLKTEKHKELYKKYKDRKEIVDFNYENTKKKYESLIPLNEDGTENKMYYQFNIDKLTHELQPLKKELEEVKGTKYREEQRNKQISIIEAEIKELESKRAVLRESMPEFVEYDSQLDIRIHELEKKSAIISNYLSWKKDYDSKMSEKEEVEKKMEPLQIRMERLYSYQAMSSTVGDIYVEVLGRLAKSFSSEKVRWYVESGTYRRKDYLIFQAQLKVKKRWRDYDSLSTGQQNIVDLDFISKMLATRSGLLALDEILKHLDENNSVEAAELLAKLNVNTLLVATHSVSFPTYTQKLRLRLDEEGRTQVSED